MDNVQMPELPVKEKNKVEKVNSKDRISYLKKLNELRKELNEIGILPKGAHNDYDNYDYFSEAQYKELFTKLFSKHGIEFRTDEVDYGTFDGTDKQPFGRVVTIDFTLTDIDTGYSETSRHTGEGLDRGDKAGYKAKTGALKSFLASTFLVATKDDPEREDDKNTVTRKSNSKNKTPGITRGQLTMLKSMYKDNKEELVD